ncbi:hypothetical protein I2494_08325 [Budviciaceae bacterium BWR-B9]|uniref:Antitoxin FitA-like ribbon-helix-helix domain-containing protein n=1 Tax=Limnobaculum allomyrinae TaxID=2791986 RepID=A0ABS1IPN6_9GAMM|nr:MULTISPECIES: hypothetical protein [Limnobaculum]MBK5143720.1 hypothetical protein [Limnobaculum allomyrinae]MBV7693459.1 hypothetical protein [Limnobaculum sp. M2-1]
MAKIQVRNFPDEIYSRIEAAAGRAERSIESECRLALLERYRPELEKVLSQRETWQKESGQRLQWLFNRLESDRFFRDGYKPETFSMTRLARMLGEISPSRLMECIEGQQEITFDLADRIAGKFDASADWLLSGEGSPFPVIRIGNKGYKDFFLPTDGQTGYTFELIRISHGRHEGTLICLRYHLDTHRYVLGVVTEAFNLANGMGGGGHSELKKFLIFLKTEGASLPLNTYEWEPQKEEDNFWEIFGQHHPVYFQDPNCRTTARWLQQLFQGEDPEDWFNGWSSTLQEIKDTPFGG